MSPDDAYNYAVITGFLVPVILIIYILYRAMNGNSIIIPVSILLGLALLSFVNYRTNSSSGKLIYSSRKPRRI